jgi:type IV pilus assembly protein PilA
MQSILKKQLGKKKGFTLVEVIVVLVILAILAAIAIPALTGYIDKARNRGVISEARTVAVALQTILSDAYGAHEDVPATPFSGASIMTSGGVATSVAVMVSNLVGKVYTTGSIISVNVAGHALSNFIYTDGTRYVRVSDGAYTVSPGAF